jgi:hypothetical protein
MYRKLLYTICSLCILSLFAGCKDDGLFSVANEDVTGNEVNIQGQISQENVTRANDSGFANDDVVGVYVVNYEDGTATLKPSGNQADNVKYTYTEKDNKWTPAFPVYWKDKSTPTDVYGYYPYSDDCYGYSSNPAVIDFDVARNQSTSSTATKLATYEASDFLWAKAQNVTPTASAINLTFKHIMAGVRVVLVEGSNFNTGEWAELQKDVVIQNTKLKSKINLTDGTATLATADNDVVSIIPAESSGEYRAVVVPQTVEAGKTLISINVGTKSYNFSRNEAMQYYAGKLHNFTIRVDNNTSNGDYTFTVIDESITPWENDPISHSAETKRYIVVNNPEAGELEQSIAAMGIDVKQLKNLKVVGKMTESDFIYIRNNITYLEAINLYETKIVDCPFQEYYYWEYPDLKGGRYDNTIPDEAFYEMRFLNYCVFPKELTHIGARAFANTTLTGSLTIPEGVTHIGYYAFGNNDHYSGGETNEMEYNLLTGELSLPTTLEYISVGAFRNCLFSGKLIIPEKVTHIGELCFAQCSGFTGELNLPSNLTELGAIAFADCKGLTGLVTIPQSITSIPERCFKNTSITGARFHNGLTEIGPDAFAGSAYKGDLELPENLKSIENGAFAYTNITHVYLPESLESFGERTSKYFGINGVFRDCKLLQDTITIPTSCRRLRESLFSGCEKITAVILPSTCEQIDNECFSNCYSLNYVRCDATTPPQLDEGAFNGVAKDNITIEVPAASVSAYRATSPWNEFLRISEYSNFVCRPSKGNVLNAGGTREIILNADAEWTVESVPDWCSISATSGNKKTQLTVKINAMSHGSVERHGQIVFKLADGHTTTYDIGQYDYKYDEDAELQLQSAKLGSGINLVFVGDGYDAEDISKGSYLSDIQQEIEYFFDVHPYREYRDYFNVYTVFAMSYDSGVGTVNTLRNTKFGSSFGSPSNYRLSCDANLALEYIVSNVQNVTTSNYDKLTAIILANSEQYDGVTTMYSNGTAISLCTKSTLDYPNDARGLLQHEAGGHAFAKFADEYIYHKAFIDKCSCTCCEHLDGFNSGYANGWFRNLSVSGKYSDIPWYHLMNDSRYSDIVDVWPGGFYHSNGIYRSESNSCMNNNVPYYSTWCRELIVRRIKEYAGETFSYDEFVANDSREYGTDFTNPYTRGEAEKVGIGTSVVHGQSPIIRKVTPLQSKLRSKK